MATLTKYNVNLTPIERGILTEMQRRGIITDFAQGTRQAIRDYGTSHGLNISDYQVITA